MRILAGILLFIVMVFCLWAIETKLTENSKNITGKIPFNVERATTNEEDLSDVTIFCIDGVRYIVVPGIGMSPKFTAPNNQSVIATVELCTNK